MALLLSAHDISKSFGSKTLFDNLSFGIENGERIGLIGPNGAGKSTLLKILAGVISADHGHLSFSKNLRIGFLEQIPSFDESKTVLETLLEGHPPHDWEIELRIQEYIAKMDLNPDAKLSTLSGGWKKRVALARELIKQPDLLLLDEPTNHLDIDSILWLENFLSKSPLATLTITHDRLFLQKVSNRILELDRRHKDGVLSIQGSYADYLEAKELLMNAQERQETVLRNTLRRETEWLRRGPKARTTKQQARIDRAGDLKEQVEDLSSRNSVRTASIDFENTSLPKRLIEAKNISKSYGERKLFERVNLLLSPGTRIGLLGPNGVGKSTLIRILVGEETPDSGEVMRADQLVVNYFEQNRDSLDPTVSLAKTVSPYGDYVEYRGSRVHIKSYLSRFLFPTAQMDLPVGQLSGGEQSRIRLAQLMLKPANLLVLDEPTNDLDIATLNVLQDCLLEFEGAILLVTHDRYFLDQVANKIIVFPPNSSQLETFSDLSQWEEWLKTKPGKATSVKESAKPTSPTPAPVKKKLSYKDQLEFDGMETKIHTLEESLANAENEIQKPEIVTNAPKLLELDQKIKSLKSEIDHLYHRWAELESMIK